MTKLSRSQY